MDKVSQLLTRGVDTIYPTKQALENVLRSGKKLRLYQGFDPTGTQLHIGHMLGLRKLRQWQDLGHQVIFLIGDGTGQAGDPSGKKRTREKYFTRAALRKNAADYVKQASKIVRFEGDNPATILFNGDWLNKLQLVDILTIAGHFSLQQLSERDIFQERMKRKEPVNLREFLYPLLQGYDSVAMKVDLELGGSDQTFNMLVGRTLVKAMLQKEKFVMTTPLLTDAKGVKIGKTEGNVIALTDPPNDLFAKIMALSDDVIVKGLEYLTDVPLAEIKTIAKALKQQENPMRYKKQLAYEIVKQLNSSKIAVSAQHSFERTVQQEQTPKQIPVITVTNPHATVIDVLVDTKLFKSKTEVKRMIDQGGIRINDARISNPQMIFSTLLVKQQAIIRIGKHRFVQIQTASNNTPPWQVE